MRLSEDEAAVITAALHHEFGEDAEVWLYGSRTDDRRRGGDIDLFVEAACSRPLAERRLRALVEMKRALGERKIDLLVHLRGEDWTPFQRLARERGVRLG